MKNFVYTGVLCLLIAGCKPGIPKELIQPDKMALVLHDIHIFDGYASSITNNDTAKAVAAGYYRGIYKKFGIDSALYARSMVYYNAHPKIMTEIYTGVVERLDKEKKALVRADSLANAKIIQKQKLKAKADSLKLKKDSIRLSDSVKIAREQKKLQRQLDSLKNLRLSPKEKAKSQRLFKKRADSLRLVKRRDSLKRAAQAKKAKEVKKITKSKTVK